MFFKLQTHSYVSRFSCDFTFLSKMVGGGVLQKVGGKKVGGGDDALL